MSVSLFISPSQIESFRLCPRKWAYNKIDRIPQAQSEAAAFGEAAHKYREDWLIHGIPPSSDDKAGRLARVGMEHLPPPGLAQVEVKLELFQQLGDKTLGITGRIDFFVPNQEEGKVFGEYGIPLVGDHKTSSGEQWVKTAEKLKGGDPQAAIYGAWAIANTRAEAVDLHWSYMIKASSPRQLQVKTRMSALEVVEQYNKVLDDAKQMLAYKEQQVSAKDVEPNPKACEAFGGCPYRDICPITNQEKIGAIMAQGSLNDMLKNLRNNGELTTAAPVSKPSSALAQAVLNPPADTKPLFSAPTPAPVASNGADPLAFLKKMQGQSEAAPAPVAAAPVAAAPAPAAADPLAFLKKIQAATPVAEPVKEEPPLAPVVESPVQLATSTSILPPPVAETPVVDYQVVPPDAPPADLTATEPEETKKRGRPKGAKRTPKDDALLQAGSEKLVEVLERIATALEKIASRD